MVLCAVTYHKPIANILWTLSRLMKHICTLQINWVSTAVQRGILFGSCCKMTESKLRRQQHNVVVTGAMNEAIRVKCIGRTIHGIDEHETAVVAAICWCTNLSVNSGHDIWMATASQLLPRMQTFLSDATVQRPLNDEDSIVSVWQASTSIIG